MNTAPPYRLRLTFSKSGAARYISHLDLARALERALNRAGLPIAYTQGFNRRPRLSLAAALPLGYTGAAEMADVWLTEPVAPELFHKRLAASMPPGIEVSQIVEAELAAPSLTQRMAASEYEVTFMDAVDVAELRRKVETLLATPELIVTHHRTRDAAPKPFDLRPFILAASVQEPGPVLRLRLVQTATQNGRPDDVLAALGFDPLDTRVHRTGLHFRDECD
jgi:radical SAM-linked protein